VFTREIWVLVHQDLKDVPRIKVCVELLVETMRNREAASGD
jgi:hypothetical protein